jgi:hypothetical protein
LPFKCDLQRYTVAAFVWKRGDDVQLHYRLKKGAVVKVDSGISSA